MSILRQMNLPGLRLVKSENCKKNTVETETKIAAKLTNSINPFCGVETQYMSGDGKLHTWLKVFYYDKV